MLKCHTGRSYRLLLFTAVTVTLAAAAVGRGNTVNVPNDSFEQDAVLSFYPDAAIWEETGPVAEDPQLPGVVDSLDTGIFRNYQFDQSGPLPYYITNAAGDQLGFIGADHTRNIAYFQSLSESFQAGSAYDLTVAVGASWFFPPLAINPNDPPQVDPGPASLALRLYYESQPGTRQTIAETLVHADQVQSTQLTDFNVSLPALATASPAVGKPIGIEIAPHFGVSGFWNLDNVRLQETVIVPEPSAIALLALATASCFARRTRRRR